MDLLRHPLRLRADLRVIEGPEGTLLLLSAHHEVALEDPLNVAVVSGVGQHRTALELVSQLRDRFSANRVLDAIVRMHQFGYLRTATAASADSPTDAAWWEAQGLSVRGAGDAAVRLRHLCGEGLETLEQALGEAGIACTRAEAASGEGAVCGAHVLDVVLADDLLAEGLEALHREMATPWMLVCLQGPEARLGPLFVPGETACWTCLAHRLRRLRPGRHVSGASPTPLSTPAAALRAAAAACAVQVARWGLDPAGHPLRNGVLSLNVARGTAQRHVLTRRPQCAVCGTPRLPDPSPVVIDPTWSGARVADPDETWERHAHLVSPITGVVSDIAEVREGNLARIFRAPEAAGLPRSWEGWRARRRNQSSGKGVTRAQGRMSALGEAVERHCSMWDGTEPRVRASFRALGAQAIHPVEMMGFSERQYANRHEVPVTSLRDHVPEPFDEEAEIDWTPVWSLTRGAWRKVASACLYMGHPERPDRLMCAADSNGNAAGGTREEAVLQGFCELVERDAVAIWWYNRLLKAAVCLDSLDDPYVEALRHRQAAAGRAVWVLDLTTDLQVPAFVAVSHRIDAETDDVSMGFGSHLDARTGMLRALTEMEQLHPDVLRHAERADRIVETDARPWRLRDMPYILPDPAHPPRPIDAFPAAPRQDPIGACRARVEAAGLEMLVGDLTRPDLGLPVVKVIVPGLRLHWRRLRPGRLYDVPVRMGWRDRPLSEDDMNPEDLRT